MTLHQNCIGVDISKDHLDVFLKRSGQYLRIANTVGEIAKLVAANPDAFFGFEATSGCDARPGASAPAWRKPMRGSYSTRSS